MNNVQILVIRIGGDRSNDNNSNDRNRKDTFINSKPCMHCINYMRSLGIRKIYYTDNTGDIIYEKINEMHSTHISMMRKVLRGI